MKDLEEASFVLGIEIHRDRRKGVLGLSQKDIHRKNLKESDSVCTKCSLSSGPIVKDDIYGDFQCPRNQCELNQMKVVPYASAAGSLQHAQVCTRPDLAFVTGFYLADFRAILK